MFRKFLVFTVLIALLISGCATAKSESAVAPGAPQTSYDEGGRNYTSGVTTDSSKAAYEMPSTAGNSGSYYSAGEQMVIKTANLQIVVADPAVSMESVKKVAEGMGGYVVNSYLYKTQIDDGVTVPFATVTIRVPAEQLDSALTQIKALVKDPAKDITYENVTGEDVTQQYTDLQSRLKNLEAAEEQLLKIMEEATKTEDVMSVFNQLTSTREQIEVLKGQIKYYEESASLSAVTVELTAQEAVQPVTIGGWEPVGIAQEALKALVDLGKGLGTILIWVIIVGLPLFLIFFFPVRWIVRKIRKAMEEKPKPEPIYPYYPPMAPQQPQVPPQEEKK